MCRLFQHVLLCLAPVALTAADLHVGSGQTFGTVRAALAAATAGDTVIVHAGVYREGSLVVDKSVTLTGLDRPHLDGEGRHEVLTIAAPHVTVRGFDIAHSGNGTLTDVAGIKIANTHHAVIERNRVEDCSFGIYLSKSHDSVIRHNEVRGSQTRAESNGNGIHAWSCERIEISDNRVVTHRDGIYLEFATDSATTRNTVEDNLRYGLHFMFSHRNRYRENTFLRNGAGVAVMYSREVHMESNHFAHSWGAAAYGLLLKDMSDSRIVGNTFDHNSTAVTMQNSNRMVFERNEFRANGWALQVQSSCNDNAFTGNNFLGNSFDLATNGQLELNRFEGNYWDKAESYDLNRDGVADTPYRPVSLFAMLVERMPSSLLLLRSPLVHFLDRAERIIPSLTPDRLIDLKPAMRPLSL
ncbi:MAG: nitrous oxide reductase family maturation protein NosD [Verrucomicrobia bacterium]|nr:nitrous oxide reductase family maturation protein NosD [Verrucomicrobiota bacterium]